MLSLHFLNICVVFFLNLKFYLYFDEINRRVFCSLVVFGCLLYFVFFMLLWVWVFCLFLILVDFLNLILFV